MTGVLTSRQAITSEGVLGQPAIAINPSGDFLIAWPRQIEATYRCQMRVRTKAGTLTPIRNVSPTGDDARRCDVGVDGDGNARFIWGADGSALKTRVLSVTGVFGPIETVTSAAYFPTVAVDPAGNAVFAWHNPGGSSRVYARARASTGVWGSVQAMSKLGELGMYPEVGMDANGGAVIAWNYWDLRARTLAADGTRGPILVISPPLQ